MQSNRSGAVALVRREHIDYGLVWSMSCPRTNTDGDLACSASCPSCR
ncbi:MAG TPA: hypothetical protein VL551_17495 [Actinospica sp.]|nr:hypothetical protein [Actinospica sp.]